MQNRRRALLLDEPILSRWRFRILLAPDGDADGCERTANADPAERLLQEEASAEKMDGLTKAIRRLTTTEAAVIGPSFGLSGQPRRSCREIARRIRCSEPVVYRAKASAMNKMRTHLQAIRHPVAIPLN